MKKVLIIEDDALTAGIYSNQLRSEGYKAEVASDGEIGMNKISQFKPDVILLDLGIPKINGLELIKKVRSNPETQALPIVVMTNAYVPTQMEQAWDAGANKCFKKIDCTPRKIVELVISMLSSQQGTVSPAQTTPPVPQAHVPSIPPRSDLSLSTLKKSFSSIAEDLLKKIRENFTSFCHHHDRPMVLRLPFLVELNATLRIMTNKAVLFGYRDVAHVTSALGAFISDLFTSPEHINTATTHTLAQGIDFLGGFYNHPDDLHRLPPNILVVDDDNTSRELICFGLAKAELNSIGISSSLLALEILKQNHFDLIFLDVSMDGINGYDLCIKIRELENNKDTPVVFVTLITDFEVRVHTKTVGANDLMVKPFMMTELMVKAVLHLFRKTSGS